jgi:low affinity Fe/Cu permease
MHPKSYFCRFTKWTSRQVGHPVSSLSALGLILLWLISGPFFGFSDTWQLVINTSTTIITFLMVFVIQNTQNRDNEALQLKLDEIIRVLEGAHNHLLDLEELSEEELDQIKNNYLKLAERARAELKKGNIDTNCPEIERLGESSI